MPASRISRVVQQLHCAVLRQDGGGLTDGRLLEAFINHGDSAAFEALVRRLGPMVWGVCRRVLGNHHDADDAFQASFLVLVRKAASIVPREMVGNWLYGVARQTALKAKAAAARRQTRESQVVQMPEIGVEPDAAGDELLPLLDQELSSLTPKYRTVIVLCDLEGKTRKQAAQQLGCPEGTIAGRLARARTMLAKRLQRRGLIISGAALSLALSEKMARACVPVALMKSTIAAAQALAAAPTAAGLISGPVVSLMEGVVKAMFLKKLKTIMTVLLVLSAATIGGRFISTDMTAGQQIKADPPVVAAGKTGKKPNAPKTDLGRLQGVWSVVSGGGGAGAVPKESVFMVDGKRFCWQTSDGDLQGGLYLDATAEPKTIDLVSHQLTIEGIYELNGNTLRLCYEMGTDSFDTEAKRPHRFVADKRQVFIVLKRLHGPEVFPYRLADGSRAFPRIVEDDSKERPVQPPPRNLDAPQAPPAVKKPSSSRANGLGANLQQLELDDLPKVVPQVPRYQFHFGRTEVGKDGEKYIPDPICMTREGEFRAGYEVVLHDGRPIPLAGIRYAAGATKLKDGSLRLDVLVEKYEQKEAGKNERRVDSTSRRFIRVVRLNAEATFELDEFCETGKRTRLHVTVRPGDAPVEPPR
jgi:RNA polymerase sigma factor (sigma-70 family)